MILRGSLHVNAPEQILQNKMLADARFRPSVTVTPSLPTAAANEGLWIIAWKGCKVSLRQSSVTEIKVECYAGYRADQRPLRFILSGNTLDVQCIEDQWYGPSAMYFRVRASDGNFYVLRHDETEDRWTLEAFRAGR